MVSTTGMTHDLSTTTLAERLVALQCDRASGELVLERGRARKTFGMLEGNLVSVESSLPSEALCTRLRDAGQLGAQQIERVERLANEQGTTQVAALASLRFLAPKQLFQAIRERIIACASEAVLWTHGCERFDATSVPSERTHAFRCDVLPLVHATLCNAWPAERIANDLASRFADHPVPLDGLAQRMRCWIGDDAAELRLLSLLDGSRTIEAVIAATFREPALLTALWIADRARLIRYGDKPRSGAGDASPIEIEIEVTTTETKTASPSDGDASAQSGNPSPEAEEVRKEVLALHEQIDRSTHYEILRIAADSPAAAIKRAYFKAAKRYHPDRLARLGVEDVKGQASEVFAAIAEAHELLSDAERRGDYDQLLATGDVADDVDVTRIAQAEGFFRKGQVLVKMGNFRAAVELLETAVELWPDECVYQATLGWARFRQTPPDHRGAAEALRRAVDIDPEDAQAHRWLSQALHALGDAADAAEHAARASRLDPTVD